MSLKKYWESFLFPCQRCWGKARKHGPFRMILSAGVRPLNPEWGAGWLSVEIRHHLLYMLHIGVLKKKKNWIDLLFFFSFVFWFGFLFGLRMIHRSRSDLRNPKWISNLSYNLSSIAIIIHRLEINGLIERMIPSSISNPYLGMTSSLPPSLLTHYPTHIDWVNKYQVVNARLCLFMEHSIS